MARQKENKSKFLQESEKTSAESGLVLSSERMTAMFEQEEEIKPEHLERMNLPRMMKPADVPIWSAENPKVLRAVIVSVVESPASTVKGFLLWLKNRAGHELTFPCTGVIRNALAPGIKVDDSTDETLKESNGELKAALDKHVGRTIILKRTANQQSQKYKKEMFMFDVFLLKE